MGQQIFTLEEIEHRRAAASLPYRSVCAEAGVAPTTWRRIMSGQHSPVMSTLEKLSAAIDRLTSARAAE